MYAVIKTGGKQYRVAANDLIQIEKLEGAAGDTVVFEEVLMVANGGAVDIGAPFVSGASVAGEIAAQERGEKIVIFKKRRRKHYRRKNGHRQLLTSVKIVEILTGGAKATIKKAEPKPKAEAKPAKAEATPEPKAAPKAEKPETAKPADDISLIGGIGPKILKGLADMGITTYAQIAGWSAEDVEKVETALKQKGRVAREEWIEQAKELMAGKPPRAKADKSRAKDKE
jgi:large subunit ribosomal protein L21